MTQPPDPQPTTGREAMASPVADGRDAEASFPEPPASPASGPEDGSWPQAGRAEAQAAPESLGPAPTASDVPAPEEGAGPRTGHAEVDAALEALEQVAALPPAEQAVAFDVAHHALQTVLATIDEG